MSRSAARLRGNRRGQALVEATLLVPMIFFLFLGMTNFGFFIHAFISVGNAARVAAQFTAQTGFEGNSIAACEVARRELRSMSNVASLTSCTGPLLVTAEAYTEPTTSTPATRVTVTYETIQLFPLPFMSGKMTINRTAIMRVMPSI
jgi:Flp pilus assembly protein TadG